MHCKNFLYKIRNNYFFSYKINTIRSKETIIFKLGGSINKRVKNCWLAFCIFI